jgi:prolyl-tRNA synthetase
LRVLKKIERIIREEMDEAGCQELLMPIIHPEEIYAESGRLKSFGPELFKLKDSKGRVFALGPTHEEVITIIARDEMRSYRDLPQTFYQILTKFRDEIRPRYGVMRAREFIMKDAYSFHADDDCLDRTYRRIETAYRRIIERCGLEYVIVEAESGYIGGSESHEFMVLAENGEDMLLSCQCGYAVNLEKAAARVRKGGKGEALDKYEEVSTPGASTIEQVSEFLGIPDEGIVKTLLYRTGERTVAVIVPGDREVNDIKLVRVFDDPEIRFLEPREIEAVTGGPVGFSGPVGLPDDVEIVADTLIQNFEGMVVGANRADTHLRGVVAGRDFKIDRSDDLVYARAGDICPNCGKGLSSSRGIEVGHIFKLGTKYSSSMNATFLDDKGESHHFIMGCYGFGVSRMVAAAIEQNFDKDGIVWPMSIAPFQVLLLPLNAGDEAVMNAATSLEKELTGAGLEVLMDDRDLSPGVKFKDADLTGVPLRITIGRKIKDGVVELFHRKTGQVDDLSLGDAAGKVLEIMGIVD